jgi:hypothetical protein
MGSVPLDESIQDQTVSASHISSLEKYKFKIDEQGLVRSRVEANFSRTPATDSFNRLRVSMPISVVFNKSMDTSRHKSGWSIFDLD